MTNDTYDKLDDLLSNSSTGGNNSVSSVPKIGRGWKDDSEDESGGRGNSSGGISRPIDASRPGGHPPNPRAMNTNESKPSPAKISNTSSLGGETPFDRNHAIAQIMDGWKMIPAKMPSGIPRSTGALMNKPDAALKVYLAQIDNAINSGTAARAIQMAGKQLPAAYEIFFNRFIAPFLNKKGVNASIDGFAEMCARDEEFNEIIAELAYVYGARWPLGPEVRLLICFIRMTVFQMKINKMKSAVPSHPEPEETDPEDEDFNDL